jgi:biopolymer transport protein TolR
MAASLRERGDGRFGRRRTRPMSEINVTPLVDVMLVLLVIFMITAPLLTTGVQVDLPKTSASGVQGQDEPVAVSIDRRGRIFIQDSEVTLDTLAPRLAAITENNRDVRVFVRGDQVIPYGQVMAVIGAVHAAGFAKVALLTQPNSAAAGAAATRPRPTGSRSQP